MNTYRKSTELNTSICTDGDGYWSVVARPVEVKSAALGFTDYNDGDLYGELQVEFDTNTWDIEQDGLIYTDSLFLEQLRIALEAKGLDASDLTYSEQGMQGENYVSLDAGPKFIASWLAKETANV